MADGEIMLNAELFDAAFQTAAKLYPHATDCLGFLWGALSPHAGITEEDRAWSERILNQAKKGTN
jgi:hypothetical protein